MTLSNRFQQCLVRRVFHKRKICRKMCAVFWLDRERFVPKSAFTPAGKKGWHESCLAMYAHVPSSCDVPAAFHPLLPMKTLSGQNIPAWQNFASEVSDRTPRTKTSNYLAFKFFRRSWRSREKFGNGRKYSSDLDILSSFFFVVLVDVETRRRHSEGCQAPPLLPCRSAEQIHARKPMGASSRVRKRSGETGAVISAFVSSSFANLRTAVLQRRKNTVLGRQLLWDVALRFAAPLVAWLHALVFVEGKLSAFWCRRPSLSHYRETCFRDPRKQLTWIEDPHILRRLGQVWPLCTRSTAAWWECSSIFSRSQAKWRHINIVIHAKEAFTAGVNAS